MNTTLRAALLLAAAGTPAAAQHAFRAPQARPVAPPGIIIKEHDEGGEIMPPTPPRPPIYSPAFNSVADDAPFIKQVNISAQGQNIVGDAANEPSLMIDPTAPNRITVGWRQFDSIASNFRQGGRAYSVDGGRTWTNPGVFTPGQFRSDPVLRASPDGHECYADIGNATTFAIDAFDSTDGGHNWSGPFPARAGDKEWIAVDRTALASRGAVYLCWQTCCGAYTTTTFTRSFDHGQTWMNPIAMPGPPIFGTMIVGPSGEFYDAGSLGGGGSTFRVVKSINAGNPAVTPTFTTSTVNLGGTFGIPSGRGDPNPAGLTGQVWVEVDRSNGPRRGWVYVLASVYRGAATPSPQDIVFSRSTDGGVTWSPAVVINNDTPALQGWHWFGTIAVAPSGRLDVIWNDTRESQNVNLSRLYYASSADGGTTWTGNTPITPQFDTSVGWPQQNKIGDYYDMEADDVGTSIIMAATFNGEEDVYFIRLGDWDCNRNGIADSIDLASGTLHDCNGNGIPDECELAAGVPVNCACYANCDGSTTPPVVNTGDFTCFLQQYSAAVVLPAAGQQTHYANCDASTTFPMVNTADFTCFLQKYAAGCT
jgi:hypothetical protein